MPDDEREAWADERLYAWVRAIGSILLIVTAVLIVLAVAVFPVFVPDYELSETTVAIIIAGLLTSALALVNVQVVLRRNGHGK